MKTKSIKEKIIEMLGRLPDDIDYDRAIEGIQVIRAIEVGREQAARGECTDHDVFMRELLGEDEEVPCQVDPAGAGAPQGH